MNYGSTATTLYNEEQYIRELCKTYTNLTDEDIEIICEQAKNLQQMADLAQANIFIDCPLKDQKHAIVVAEAVPTTAPSLYTNPVVGKIAYNSYEPAVYLVHQRGKPVFRKRAITQEGKLVKQSVVPIRNKLGQTIGTLIMEQDISEQANSEKQLKFLSKTTEQLSQTLIGLTEPNSLITDLIQEAVFLVDVQGKVVYANTLAMHMAEELHGEGEIIDHSFSMLFPWAASILNHPDDILFEEVKLNQKVYEVKSLKSKKDQELIAYLILVRDISDLREKERQLIVKSAVIKEIHHRVKNSLQTIASLIRLQMKRGVPEASIPYFKEIVDRILSIATVHNVLSDSTSDEVECLSLLNTIASNLVINQMHGECQLNLTVEGDRVLLPSNRAISLALIVHELIQNSIKHAFPDRETGQIYIGVKEEHDILTVIVRDDGIGYDEEQPSLGLEIVHLLVQYDLSGHYTIETKDQGTTVTIQFPLAGDEK